MLEGIALNDLISGKPKVSDITQNEKIPPEGYKLTGRVNRLKNYNTDNNLQSVHREENDTLHQGTG